MPKSFEKKTPLIHNNEIEQKHQFPLIVKYLQIVQILAKADNQVTIVPVWLVAHNLSAWEL